MSDRFASIASRVARLTLLRRANEVLPYVTYELSSIQTAERDHAAIKTVFLEVIKAGEMSNKLKDTLELVRNWYGLPAFFPSEILIASVVSLLRSHQAAEARSYLESWLSESTDTEVSYQNYEQIVELYVVHTLNALGDYQASREFLRYDESLSQAARTRFQSIIDKLEKTANEPPPSPPPVQTTATSSSSPAIPTYAKENQQTNASAIVQLPKTSDPSQKVSQSTPRQRRVAKNNPDPLSDLVQTATEFAPALAAALLIIVLFWYRQRLARSPIVARALNLISETLKGNP